jgi:hypothetical protein
MADPSVPLPKTLRRFARRVAIGQFLDIWPFWAACSLLAAGLAVLICRVFFAEAASFLPWLWMAPFAALIPSLIIWKNRAYQPEEIVALADSLAGGHGTLLAIHETGDTAWVNPSIGPPRLRPWRGFKLLLLPALFLGAALLLPQRFLSSPGSEALANSMETDLKTTVAGLKQQDLITPAEEKALQEEIERIKKSAAERMDSSSWEAADALKEKTAASLSEKLDALKWAKDSAARYSAAAQAGASNGLPQSKELSQAIERLEKMDMLSDASAELQNLLGGQQAIAGGKVQLPKDAASLKKLSDLLAAHVAKRGEAFTKAAKLGREFGRFDPREFAFSYERGPDGDGDPGAGGLNRGRGDAELTWGRETIPYDRFKAVPLPPGSVRSPDDWAPIATLPGAPRESAVSSVPAAMQQYANTPGLAAWRRTLAPRHYAAVKKYFGESSPISTP